MKKILSRFRHLGRHQGLWMAGLFVLSLVLVEPVFAADTPPDANAALLGLGSILAIVVNILTFLVILIMSWGGDLIGTTFITGPDAMETIRPMWVFVRNLVNISFVLVLMFLAFANLFSSLSGGQGSWTIKDKLPRVIIALIAVNFSLLIFRVAIDAVHVGTITILSITDTVMEEKAAYNPVAILNRGIDNLSYEPCDNLTTDTGASPTDGTGACLPFYRYVEDALCTDENTDDSDCLLRFSSDVRENQSGLIQASSSTEQNIFWAFGVYFQKLELLPILAGRLDSLTGVISSTFFSAIMAIMYAVAWVAIFIALAIRVVMLWFFMIMSPALVAAQIMGISSGGGEFNIQQRLVTNLIMPLKIAAAFALSFVMIATMIQVMPEMQTTAIFEPGRTLGAFWGVTTSPFSIMWQIMTVVVFWMTVWWALSGSEAELINNGIKSGAEQLGKFTGKIAIDRVTAPVPMMNPRVLGQLPNRLNSAADNRLNAQVGGVMRPLNDLLGFDQASESAQRMAREFNEVARNMHNQRNLHDELSSRGWTIQTLGELSQSDLQTAFGNIPNETVEEQIMAVAELARRDPDGAAERYRTTIGQNMRRLPIQAGSTSQDETPAAITLNFETGEESFRLGDQNINSVDALSGVYADLSREAREVVESQRLAIERALRIPENMMLSFEDDAVNEIPRSSQTDTSASGDDNADAEDTENN